MLTVAAIATAAVVAAAAVAAAVTLTGTGQPKLKSSDAATVTATFSAQAAVSPPVTASNCTTAATFAFSGTLTATAPGDVSYRWVYSSGQPGPVRTVSFPGPGKLDVAGKRLTTTQPGSGWGEIKLVHPGGAKASNRASYRLLCASSAGGISAVAAVHPATQTMTCGTPPPSFTAEGSITSQRAGPVSYYWALANGRDSAPGSLTFSGPGTMAVAPLAITPAAPAVGTPASGEAVLVVTSPAAAASSPAGYTVTCTAPQVTAAAAVSPATDTVTSCSAAAPAFAFTGTVTAGQGGAVSYYWRLPGGSTPVRTLHFGAAGTQAVAAASYRPATDTASGSGTLVVTSPAAATSNAAAFTLTCGQALSISISGASTATAGKAYSATATVAGGKGGYTWAVTGLPAGLKSTVAGGKVTVSGTPTKAGSYTVTLTAKDGESPARSASASFALTVSAPALTLAGGTLTAATTGTAYTHTLTASGGTRRTPGPRPGCPRASPSALPPGRSAVRRPRRPPPRSP